MSIFKNKTFLSVVMGHFMVDVLNGGRSVLLTFLSGVLGLTNAALGFYAMMYQMASAIVQPLFGYITDRFGVRWVVTGGVLWMGGFFTLAMLAPAKWTILLMIVASMGSGAFHPAGASQATLSGREYLAGQEAIAASYFFLFGEIGFFVGPILAGAILVGKDLSVITFLSVLAIPVSIFCAFALRGAPSSRTAVDTDVATDPRMPFGKVNRKWVITALIVVAGFQSWVQQNMTVYLPKFLSDLGQPSPLYGFLVSLFVGGTALGLIIGGRIADRKGKAQTIMVSMTSSCIPLMLIPLIGYSPALFPVAVIIGMLTGAAYSSIVVLAQRIIPGGQGLASGLILGFIFSSGAVGSWLSGWLADQLGTLVVFYLSAVLALIAGLAAILLIDRKTAWRNCRAVVK